MVVSWNYFLYLALFYAAVLFSYSPGSWNHKDVNGFKVAQVPKAPTPLAVERLKLQSKECLKEIQQQLEEEEQRNDESGKVTVQLPHSEFYIEKPEPRSVIQVSGEIRHNSFRYSVKQELWRIHCYLLIFTKVFAGDITDARNDRWAAQIQIPLIW